jgi:hypothetical protein
MRRILLLSLLFFLLIPTADCAAAKPLREFNGNFTPANNGERLLAFLVSLTDPEVLELHMDQQPDNDGNVRNISIFISGASIGGFRVERIALESSFLELNPPSAWKMGDKDSFQAKSALRTNVELVALEKDLNTALTSYAGGGWRRVFIDLKPGKIYARGNYRSGSLDLLAEVTTGLEVRQGKQIWLKDTSIKINRDDQTDFVQDELRKIQPVVDIGSFPFPVSLAVLSVDEQKIVFSTRTLPKPVKGIFYRYVRGS